MTQRTARRGAAIAALVAAGVGLPGTAATAEHAELASDAKSAAIADGNGASSTWRRARCGGQRGSTR